MWTSSMLISNDTDERSLGGRFLVVARQALLSTAILVLLCISDAGYAASDELPSAAGRKLENISYSALGGDRVQIKLTFSEAAPQPLSFTVDNPARIALDLPDTSSVVSRKAQDIDIGVAKSINAVEVKGRTRVVVNLVKLVAYDTQIEGNDLYVTIESGAAPQMAAQPPVGTQPQTASMEKSITNVDFRRSADGAGMVLVSLSDPTVGVDVREQGNKVVVDFPGAGMPEQLERRLDVLDFATPVKTIDTSMLPNKVRMTIAATGDFEYSAYQTDKLFTVEVREKAKNAAQPGEEREYTGERLTFNFQNIEVRSVLQLIADFTDRNLVASDSVQGNITLRLKNVPWDQALDIILQTKGLAMRESGNVMLVAPAAELTNILQQEQKVAEAAPLKSELIQINYARAGEIASLLRSESSSVMSARGTIAIDERTNTLIVQDTADKIEEMRKLVAKLDIPVRQVMIESRIVIANNDFNKELGVRFGGAAVTTNADGTAFASSGNITAARSSASLNQPVNGLNVDLPVASPAGSIALAVLDPNYLIDLELSALQAEGRGEVVSNPRVITANQREAVIQQGVEIPYQEASSSGATSISFKQAVLSLKVTPQITPDDRIILDLTVNKDSIGEVFAGVPSIDTRQVTTQVLVNNGETVVLGGIYEQEQRQDVSKVPLFGDLPVIGALFRSKGTTDNKEELLIFVTPKILKEGLNVP